jgi:cellulose synthase/poly-beta-1,6-N-acetylglucosamine synthase-like glycosyltransferase
MCKWQRMIPRHKGSPRYRIAHGRKIEYGSFNFEALKFLMHLREPGGSIYFYFYTYLYFFIFLIFLFLSFFFFLIFFLSFIKFFIYSPFNSKIASYLPPPPCLDVCSSSSKEVINKVGTGNIFSWRDT